MLDVCRTNVGRLNFLSHALELNRGVRSGVAVIAEHERWLPLTRSGAVDLRYSMRDLLAFAPLTTVAVLESGKTKQTIGVSKKSRLRNRASPNGMHVARAGNNKYQVELTSMTNWMGPMK